jgi:tight adherence protein C
VTAQAALLAVGAAALVLLLASAALVMRAAGRARLLRARITAIHGGATGGPPAPPLPMRLLLAVGAGMTRSGMLSAKTLAEFEQTLSAAGYRGDRALALFLGGKVVLLLGLPALAFLLLRDADIEPFWFLVAVVGSAVAGMLLPDMILRNMRKRYLKTVENGLADALDLLVICAEAGLSLEAGVDRVAQELRAGNAAIANELGLTANELRIMTDRRLALVNLGKRTGLDSLKRLSGTLSQTLQYGTPLTQALRVLAAEMRQEMLTRFEAKAAKLPVLLTVPMIVFILPCVFLIVGGPAVVQVVGMSR